MKRLTIRNSAILVFGLMTAALAGCGSSNREGAVVAAKVSEATCFASACHGDQKSAVTGASLTDEFRVSKHFTTAGVGCQDCHGGGSLHHGEGPMPYANPDTAGICDDCHTSTSLGAPHFNNVTTLTVGATVTYPATFVNTRNTNSCRNCHNPHSTAFSYNGQDVFGDYADSAHGDVNGEGWVHYKWKLDSRASCQRCHTTTGLIANLNGTTATFGAGNNEVLDCTGCHVNYNFSVNNLRDVDEIDNPGFTNVTSIHFADAGSSNICLKCHVGREAGHSIKKSTAFRNFTGTTSFINSHYLTAGGVVFAKTGYEFDGLDYRNVTFFAHDAVGGADGACVGCHMSTPNSHKFEPVTKDGAGTVTAITSTSCVGCHGGALDATALEAEKTGIDAAAAALQAALAAKGIYFINSNPYFFKSASNSARSNAVTKWAVFPSPDAMTGRNTMGAAFNLNMIKHDPGAYAHNRFYVKALLWDSIDWIYNGAIDNDVTAAIDAQAAASRITAQQAIDAKAYLGGARPGNGLR